MSIDISEFENIEDVDIHFKKELRKAPDEEAEAIVRDQWKDGTASFWRNQAQKQALSVAKRDALDKYPLAKDFADDIRGGTASEVEASAKRFHERVEKLQGEKASAEKKAVDDDAAQRAQAQQQYGSPVGAGGGTPMPPAVEDNEAIKQRVFKRLVEGQGMQGAQAKMDAGRYNTIRLREAVVAAQDRPRYKDPGKEKKVNDDRLNRS